jgi:hypothetical protein
VSSRTSRAIQRNPVSKNKKNKKQKNPKIKQTKPHIFISKSLLPGLKDKIQCWRIPGAIDFFFFFQATLQDLEQRRPQLEELITAAQNLKNKTSNQEARTIITDRSKSLNGPGKVKLRCVKISVTAQGIENGKYLNMIAILLKNISSM